MPDGYRWSPVIFCTARRLCLCGLSGVSTEDGCHVTPARGGWEVKAEGGEEGKLGEVVDCSLSSALCNDPAGMYLEIPGGTNRVLEGCSEQAPHKVWLDYWLIIPN